MTLIINHPWDEIFEGKDVFLVPYYIGKVYHYDVKIVFPSNKIPERKSLRGIELHPVLYSKNLPQDYIFGFKLMKYLCNNARKIDLFMRFHATITTAIMIILYKMLNKHGIAYLKLDNSGFLDFEYKRNLKSVVRKFLYTRMFTVVDCISCETKYGFEKFSEGLSGVDVQSKLCYVPNGFDEEYLERLNMREYSYGEKENLIITVGRLGTFQKNTEMFLSALKSVDLKSWKVCLIGPVEESFQAVIEHFFEEHPEKKENIVFVGGIFDKKELWGYYNRAKVFVLTSRCESYALVLNEATRFKNYLVSTDVGAFNDLSENGKYGTAISKDSEKELSDVLNNIINGEINIDVYRNDIAEQLSWENMVKKIKR